MTPANAPNGGRTGFNKWIKISASTIVAALAEIQLYNLWGDLYISLQWMSRAVISHFFANAHCQREEKQEPMNGMKLSVNQCPDIVWEEKQEPMNGMKLSVSQYPDIFREEKQEPMNGMKLSVNQCPDIIHWYVARTINFSHSLEWFSVHCFFLMLLPGTDQWMILVSRNMEWGKRMYPAVISAS